MNDRRPNPLFAALAFACMLSLSACGTEPAGPPPLDGARMRNTFTLTDQNGRQRSDAEFRGKYRLVYFGYTSCPDVCPIDLQLATAALRQFEAKDPARAARVQPLFITTDPARDTPQVLRQFVDDFHPRLIGLTGTPAQIGQVARVHGVYFSAREKNEQGAYLVDHMRTMTLYGPAGEPIALLPEDQGPAGLLAALERWVR